MLFRLHVDFVLVRLFLILCAFPRLVASTAANCEVQLKFHLITGHLSTVIERDFLYERMFGVKVQPDMDLESRELEESSHSTVGRKLFTLLVTRLVA